MGSIETLTKDYINEIITRPFNFRNANIKDWQQSKSLWKETVGYLILTEVLGPLQWIENKTLQKLGVDFIYKGKLSDLKSLVGDYHTEEGLCITIEKSQYGKPSLTSDKLTDVLVYTVLEETGVSIVFIDYKKLCGFDFTKYPVRLSNNGTGEYWKVPVRDLKGISFVKGGNI